jgi:serine/threonine protein kinase
MKTFGYNTQYNILIMELLGPSLENLFQKLNKKFSLKTACMLGIQMVDRIEYIHSRKILHRDIKPDNFVIGRGNHSHIVYILDFGLSKKYWSSRQNKHIPFCKNKKLTGTARYASINALSGYEQGRRDDLESIGYIIMYFVRGSLPWQGLKVNNKEDRYKKIRDKKRATSSKELCDGFPKELENFVSYTRKLEFMEVPDYNYLRDLLKRVINHEYKAIDFFYDWCTTKPNIKSNDIIFRNNYNIKYDEDSLWLNRKYCKGELNNENSNNKNKTGNIYISKNNLVPEHMMPKAIKDENSHIDDFTNNTRQQMSTEVNSLAPQYSSSNIFNINCSNKEV